MEKVVYVETSMHVEIDEVEMSASPLNKTHGGGSVFGLSSPFANKKHHNDRPLNKGQKNSSLCTDDRLQESLFEDSFRSFLASLKHTIMSCSHPNFDNDQSVLRANELVNEEIRKTMFQLSFSDQYPTCAQRVTALSYIGSMLLREVEEMQNCVSLFQKVEMLTHEREKMKKFYNQREVELNTTMILLEKNRTDLATRNEDLEVQVADLRVLAADTQRELDIRNVMDEESHEKFVQMHMDIMEYNSTIKTKAEECLKVIKSRVGFIPREVESQMKELKEIEPPLIDMIFAGESSIRKKRAVDKEFQKGEEKKLKKKNRK